MLWSTAACMARVRWQGRGWWEPRSSVICKCTLLRRALSVLISGPSHSTRTGLGPTHSGRHTHDRDGVFFTDSSIAGNSEKRETKGEEARSPRREGEGQGRKSKRQGRKKTCTHARKGGRGGSHYKKWAPGLTFWSKKHMCPSAFLRGFLRAIVSDLSSHNAMEHEWGSTQQVGKLRRLRIREGRVGDT